MTLEHVLMRSGSTIVLAMILSIIISSTVGMFLQPDQNQVMSFVSIIISLLNVLLCWSVRPFLLTSYSFVYAQLRHLKLDVWQRCLPIPKQDGSLYARPAPHAAPSLTQSPNLIFIVSG
jgi:uncharacterized membrane protein